jgi:hypothetical protein
MILFPIRREIIREVIIAAADRKEMKVNNLAPGKLSDSRYLNKE